MTATTPKETLSFQTEVQQLLHLMIHSLYSNKEIFLRELISNASDALDKLRFEALSDDALYENDGELKIWVSVDKTARTITVKDNGIGMTRTEVIDNIGTIAKSGTKEFVKSLTGDQAKDSHLIGQFGVGFYSVFIVADQVSLTTRRAGLGQEHGVKWSATGTGSYEIEVVEKQLRGTEIIIHLKEEGSEFLDDFRLRSIIHKYSEHIAFPIVMREYQSEEDEKKGTPTKDEVVNKATALWVRSKNDISESEYQEFYKHISHDFEEPLVYLHSRVEGANEYTLLLYVPKHAPFDLWERERRHGVKLYVRRVFILDDSDKLLPHYLRFIKGVIDSNDLPLNVSREILQQNKLMETIRSGSVRKILDLLGQLAKNETQKYATFWQVFGQVLKEGIVEDNANRERIAKLLRFSSTQGEGSAQTVTLEDYISRMQPEQDKIYYITGDSYGAAANSPHLELLKHKNIEVLILSDRIDEWVASHLLEFEGKKLQSVAKGAVDMEKLVDTDQKAELDKANSENQDLLKRIGDVLADKVKQVKVSARLTTSPACLVADEYDLGIHMERILKAAGQAAPASKPILEVNLKHPLLEKIKSENDELRFKDWSCVLYGQAVLSGGGQLEDPAGFVKQLNELMLIMSDRRIILPP